MNDFKRVGDKILTVQTTGLFSGYIPIEVPIVQSNELVLNYSGGKIDSNVWSQIKSFLQWTYTNSGGEGQIRLFYNPITCTWKAHPFEQFVSKGLSTDEKKDSDLSKKVVELMLSQGYINNGTVHHHCSISAFQSGTDLADEIRQNGLHITLGYMDKDVYGYHSRATLRGICYSIIDSEWIDELDLSNIGDSSFPPEWKNYVVEKPVVPVRVFQDAWFESSFESYSDRYRKKINESLDIPTTANTLPDIKQDTDELYDLYKVKPDVVRTMLFESIDENSKFMDRSIASETIKDMILEFCMDLIHRYKYRLVDMLDIISYMESLMNLSAVIDRGELDKIDDIVFTAMDENLHNSLVNVFRYSIEDFENKILYGEEDII